METIYFICLAHKNRSLRNFSCCLDECRASIKLQRTADWPCLKRLREHRKSQKLIRRRNGKETFIDTPNFIEYKGEATQWERRT